MAEKTEPRMAVSLPLFILVVGFVAVLLSLGLIYYYTIDANLTNSYNNILAENQAFQNNFTSLNSSYYALQVQQNILQSQYGSLQDQYSTLQNETNSLSQIASLTANATLEFNRVITLNGGDSYPFFYSLNYAGYVTVDYVSDTPVYFVFYNENYAYQIRMPSTLADTSGSYVIPVLPGTNTMEIHDYVANPATITLNLTYFY